MYNYSNLKKNPKAVALGYDEKNDHAPKILASGHGLIADAIIEIARDNNVPLHKDANLVEILSLLDIDESIPIEVYAVVAEIFTYIYEQNKQKKLDKLKKL